MTYSDFLQAAREWEREPQPRKFRSVYIPAANGLPGYFAYVPNEVDDDAPDDE